MPRFIIFCCLSLAAMLPAAEKSLSLAFGPRNQLLINANRGSFGAYIQPIFGYSDAPQSAAWEAGGRLGVQYTYTALSWKGIECRAQVGAGAHYAWRMDSRGPLYEGDPGQDLESSQEGLEFWIQPEFRLRERFALLLDAHFLRYLKETDLRGEEFRSAGFVTPDFTLGGIGLGVRYYLPFGRP